MIRHFIAALVLLSTVSPAAFAASLAADLQKSWAHATRSGTPPHARYRALADYMDAEEVVLTGLGTGWALPTFAGRVIATQHPLYWVPDHDERRRALQRFFAPGSSREERLEVIRRYDARFVLVDRGGRLHRRVQRDLLSLGPVVYRGKGFELVEVSPPSE